MRRLTATRPDRRAAGLALGVSACGSSSELRQRHRDHHRRPRSRSPPRRSGTPAGSTELRTDQLQPRRDRRRRRGPHPLPVHRRHRHDLGLHRRLRHGVARPRRSRHRRLRRHRRGDQATQADGAKQIALNGHLLYYYAADVAPGPPPARAWAASGTSSTVPATPSPRPRRPPAPATDPGATASQRRPHVAPVARPRRSRPAARRTRAVITRWWRPRNRVIACCFGAASNGSSTSGQPNPRANHTK